MLSSIDAEIAIGGMTSRMASSTLREDLLGLLEARARAARDVQAELAGVHRREEVASDERQERRTRCQRGYSKQDEDVARCCSDQRERIDVTLPQSLEPRLERLLDPGRRRLRRRFFAFVTAKQILHHRRHERARQQVRRQHREDHGQRERREQIFRRAGQEDDRHEDDADGKRGDEGGHGDLLRAVEDRPLERLAQCEVAVDVFDLDRGVVDQDADRQREAAQRHHVEGLAEQTQNR